MDALLALEREYELKRSNNQKQKEENIKNAYDNYPRLKEIDEEIRKNGIQSAKLSISDKSKQAKDEISKLLKTIEKLSKEKQDIIKKEKIVIEPEYSCNKCKDTGYTMVDNQSQMCTCMRQRLINYYYNQFNTFKLQDDTFEKFDYSLYSDKPDAKKYNSSISPRENIKKIVEISKNFIDGTEEENLLFSGSSGIGKTFLSGCIANEFLKKNKTVIYQTAPILFNSIFEYKYGSNNSKFKDLYDSLFDVDLLIIDDLGTENTSDAKYAELFTIINTRILNPNAKTIISTNLDIEKLGKAYDDRLFSRFTGDYTILKFFGDDIRQLKYN